MSKTDSKKNTVEWKQLDWRKIQSSCLEVAKENLPSLHQR